MDRRRHEASYEYFVSMGNFKEGDIPDVWGPQVITSSIPVNLTELPIMPCQPLMCGPSLSYSGSNSAEPLTSAT